VAQPTSSLSGSSTFLTSDGWSINQKDKITSISTKGNPKGWFTGQDALTIESRSSCSYTLKIKAYQDFAIKSISVPTCVLVDAGGTS
jgi:hypothetical protein